jgi:hypothetical protein
MCSPHNANLGLLLFISSSWCLLYPIYFNYVISSIVVPSSVYIRKAIKYVTIISFYSFFVSNLPLIVDNTHLSDYVAKMTYPSCNPYILSNAYDLDLYGIKCPLLIL